MLRLIFGFYWCNGGRLRGASGIFRVQAGGGHDGETEVLRGNDKSFGWRCSGRFFGGGRDEAIAPADHSLEVLRLVGIVGQGAANLADGGIDSLFDVDEDVFAPERAGDLLTRDQLPLLFNQEHKQLQRQALQLHGDATVAELKTTVIQLEVVEANRLLRHSTTPTSVETFRYSVSGTTGDTARRVSAGSEILSLRVRRVKPGICILSARMPAIESPLISVHGRCESIHQGASVSSFSG